MTAALEARRDPRRPHCGLPGPLRQDSRRLCTTCSLRQMLCKSDTKARVACRRHPRAVLGPAAAVRVWRVPSGGQLPVPGGLRGQGQAEPGDHLPAACVQSEAPQHARTRCCWLPVSVSATLPPQGCICICLARFIGSQRFCPHYLTLTQALGLQPEPCLQHSA